MSYGRKSRLLIQLAWLLPVSWVVMAFSHEAGHILGGWSCGGTLADAELRPWKVPHSLFRPDPRPLVTLWCGPVLGVVMPLAAAAVIRHPRAWFVAWFCCLGNGTYLSLAWVTGDRLLDTARLLNHRASPILVGAYCLATVTVGYIGFRRMVLRLMQR